MTKIQYASTASFCVENARELGIPAALLLDKIVRLSRSTKRKDGFCWYTAKQFEEETSLKKRAFDNAAHKLEERGIVERKITYIAGTMERASHFRLIPQNEQIQSASEALCIESASEALSVNTMKYNKRKSKFASELTPPPENFPIGAPMEVVSVRPNKKETDSNKKPYAVAQVVLRAWGYKFNKIGAPIAKLFKAWLDAGFTTEQIIEAGNMMKESGEEYWQKATPIQMLTENAMLWYQTNLKKKALEGMPCREIGGKTYRCDPSTGAIIEEVKF